MSEEAQSNNLYDFRKFRDETQPMRLSKMLESDDPEQVYLALKKFLPGLSWTVSRLNLSDLLAEFEIRMFESRRGGEFHDAGLYVVNLLAGLEFTARDFWAHPGKYRNNNPEFLKLIAESCFCLYAFRSTRSKTGMYCLFANAGIRLFECLSARQYYAEANRRIVKHFYPLALLLGECANEQTVAK